jgi:hypothetical protein
MSSKKKNPTTGSANMPSLTIGSRVRCTDDGVSGRIVWANSTSVKITWDDGEQITWRRDSLAGRPIEFLGDDAASEGDHPPEPRATDTTQEETSPEQTVAPELPATASEPTPAITEQATTNEIPAAGTAAPSAEQTGTTPCAAGPGGDASPATASTERTRQRKAPAAPREKN